jgi:hypothetical protein
VIESGHGCEAFEHWTEPELFVQESDPGPSAWGLLMGPPPRAAETSLVLRLEQSEAFGGVGADEVDVATVPPPWPPELLPGEALLQAAAVRISPIPAPTST